MSHIVSRLLRFERDKVLGHKTKVTAQNRSFAAPLLTSVIIDCVEVEWGVIQRLDGAEIGLQSCCDKYFGWRGSEFIQSKGREADDRSVRIWMPTKFNNRITYRCQKWLLSWAIRGRKSSVKVKNGDLNVLWTCFIIFFTIFHI